MNKIGRKILITIGIVGLLLAGCSSKGNNQMSTVPGEEQITKEEKALTEIYDEITENVELPKMVVLNDNYIANYFAIELSGLEEYVFTNAEEVIYADTIIIIKAKPDTDKEALQEALETMIEHKKAELENYLPEQFKIVEKSKVQVSGDYIYLVISEKEADINAIIEKYVK